MDKYVNMGSIGHLVASAPGVICRLVEVCLYCLGSSIGLWVLVFVAVMVSSIWVGVGFVYVGWVRLW